MKLCILLFYLSVVNAFYFYVLGGDRKCFYKELSQGTLLLGKYNVEAFDPQLNQFKAVDSKELGVIIDVEVCEVKCSSDYVLTEL